MSTLVESILRSVSSDQIDTLAGRLGENPQTTRNALGSIVPMILAAFANRAQGGGDISGLIRSALAGGNPLDGVDDAIAHPDRGSSLVSGLFGDNPGMASQLASTLGIGSSSVNSLLGLGGMLSAGGIARAIGGDPTPQAINDVMGRERSGLMAAVPAGLAALLGGIGSRVEAVGDSVAAAAGRVGDRVEAAIDGDPRTDPLARDPDRATTAYRTDDVVDDRRSGMGWLPWVLLALAAAALLWALKSCSTPRPAEPVVDPAPVSTPADTNVAMAEPAPAAAAPTGSAVVVGSRNARPMLTVYFDTAKSAVHNDLGRHAATLKTYLDANATARLSVSGFNDPTGNAAANAKLSKDRADAVKAALVGAGLPADRIDLDKPAAATGTGATNAESRRVEVTIK